MISKKDRLLKLIKLDLVLNHYRCWKEIKDCFLLMFSPIQQKSPKWVNYCPICAIGEIGKLRTQVSDPVISCFCWLNSKLCCLVQCAVFNFFCAFNSVKQSWKGLGPIAPRQLDFKPWPNAYTYFKVWKCAKPHCSTFSGKCCWDLACSMW